MREDQEEREPAGRAPQAEKPEAEKPEAKKPQAEKPEAERKVRDRGEDWADEAARARTADDSRAAAPHDTAGVPTTGSTTGRRAGQ